MRRLLFASGIVLMTSMAGVAQTPAVRTFTPERFYNTLSEGQKARYLAKIGEPPCVPARSPNRGPPYWKSTVLRRQAGSDGQ